MQSESDDRTGNLILIAALVASIAAAVFILSMNHSMYERIANLRGRNTEISSLGSVSGWQMRGAGEWKPVGRDARVVLFRVMTQGMQGDLGFWQEVAHEIAKDSPGFQFVGVCLEALPCDSTPGQREGITLLTALDPFQMRSLVLASMEGSALVYRGSMLQSKLVIGDGTHATSAKLAELSKKMNEYKAGAED